jgi:hypothetical protein
MGLSDVHRAAAEGRSPGKALVANDPERVQIGLRSGRGPAHSLGRKVSRSADQGARAGHRLGPDRAGDAEVRDLHLAIRADQQVGGLDISVDHSRRVCRVQAGGHLRDQVRGSGGTYWSGGEHGRQGRPVDEFHNQERHVVRGVLAVVVHAGYGCMAQGRGVACLGPESGSGLCFGGVLGLEHFHRDLPLQHLIRRPPDHACAPRGNPLCQTITIREHKTGTRHGYHCDLDRGSGRDDGHPRASATSAELASRPMGIARLRSR